MDWLLLSLISAAGFTAMTIVMKRTLEWHVNGAVAFNAVAALPQLGIGVVILALSPPDWSSAAVAIMLAAGLTQSTVWLLQGYAFNREKDISRIVPIIDSHPLLVLIIAVVALGEVLTPIMWIAALLVMAGVMIASRSQRLPGERRRLTRSFFAVLGAAVAMALVTVLFSIATAELSIVQMIGLSWVVASITNLIIARVAHAGHEMRRVLGSGRALRMVSLSQVAFTVALFSGIAALSLGPVSLVTAVMGTRPVMLLLWIAISGLRIRGVLTRRSEQGGIGFKWASASLVTAGVAVMAF
jgi:drug/metabolite transporter (DMT)-like permease